LVVKVRGKEQLNYPLGIEYYENSIYICDYENQRVQKLSEDLILEESYPLNFKPWKIRILKNVACVRPGGESFIAFYSIKPFYFISKSFNGNGDIYGLNYCFYEYQQPINRLNCYDVNGNLIEKIDFKLNFNKSCMASKSIVNISYFNGQFIIGFSKEKKIILL
jgi:hypothetical protein